MAAMSADHTVGAGFVMKVEQNEVAARALDKGADVGPATAAYHQVPLPVAEYEASSDLGRALRDGNHAPDPSRTAKSRRCGRRLTLRVRRWTVNWPGSAPLACTNSDV